MAKSIYIVRNVVQRTQFIGNWNDLRIVEWSINSYKWNVKFSWCFGKFLSKIVLRCECVYVCVRVYICNVALREKSLFANNNSKCNIGARELNHTHVARVWFWSFVSSRPAPVDFSPASILSRIVGLLIVYFNALYMRKAIFSY